MARRAHHVYEPMGNAETPQKRNHGDPYLRLACEVLRKAADDLFSLSRELRQLPLGTPHEDKLKLLQAIRSCRRVLLTENCFTNMVSDWDFPRARSQVERIQSGEFNPMAQLRMNPSQTIRDLEGFGRCWTS
jgi:hypothetical protein